jgi:hypothetical protein
VSHRSESKGEDDFAEQLNPSTPVRTITSFSGQMETTRTTPNASYGYGVLVPNELHGSAPFPNTPMQNSGYILGNNGTSPQLSSDWPASGQSQIPIGNMQYSYPHSGSIDSSLPFTVAGIQRSVDHVNSHPSTPMPQKFRGASIQLQEPRFDANFNPLVNGYDTFCRTGNATLGTSSSLAESC